MDNINNKYHIYFDILLLKFINFIYIKFRKFFCL